jgi:hypothetical protein
VNREAHVRFSKGVGWEFPALLEPPTHRKQIEQCQGEDRGGQERAERPGTPAALA